MGMLIIDDEVLYDGDYEERKGQMAIVAVLGDGPIIEIVFSTEDTTGSKRLTTTRDSVVQIGVRHSMELHSYRPPVDDGRTTDTEWPVR